MTGPARVLVATVAATVAVAPVARAQDAKAKAAEALFREGKRLLEARDYAQACPKLAESYPVFTN